MWFEHLHYTPLWLIKGAFLLLLYIQSWEEGYYTANGVGGWEPTICRIIATSMTFGQIKVVVFCIKLHAGKNVYNKNVLAHFCEKLPKITKINILLQDW